MLLKKIVKDSVSWAAMGCALTGVAAAQIPDVGLGAAASNNGAQIAAEATNGATAPAAAVDAAAKVNANAQNVEANAGVQSNQIQAGGNAALRNDGVNIDSKLRSNTNVGENRLNSNTDVTGSQNGARINQSATGSSNLNPFGATFDANATDRLIIQESAPNSAAARLGLQAGDRIIGVNGRTYTDVNQFNQDLGQLNGNNNVPIIYERDGQVYTRNFQAQFNNDQQNSSGHQSHHGSTYGSHGVTTQSYDAGQISHSVGRPTYGGQGHSGYYGGMDQNQGYVGGSAQYGSNYSQTQTCCSQAVAVQVCSHRTHHHVRRNRNRCCH